MVPLWKADRVPVAEMAEEYENMSISMLSAQPLCSGVHASSAGLREYERKMAVLSFEE
jgi:hypothetical protein